MEAIRFKEEKRRTMEKANIQLGTHLLKGIRVIRNGAAKAQRDSYGGGTILCFLGEMHANACILKYIWQVISQL